MLPYSSHICDSAGIVHQLPLVHFDFSQPEMQENMIFGHMFLVFKVMALRKLIDNANTFTDSRIVYCFLLHMSNFKHHLKEPRANPKQNWTKK